jgi:hypothetical protein
LRPSSTVFLLQVNPPQSINTLITFVSNPIYPGGWGLGVDRLVMFLSNNYSIKEVLTFPFMKDIDEPTAAEVVDIEPKPVEGIAHK